MDILTFLDLNIERLSLFIISKYQKVIMFKIDFRTFVWIIELLHFLQCPLMQ